MRLFNTVDGTGTLYGTTKRGTPAPKPVRQPAKKTIIPLAPLRKTPVIDLGEWVRNQQITQRQQQQASRTQTTTSRNTGPSAADLARQAEQRAIARQKEAEEKARQAANRQARTTATLDIQKLNSQITGNQARLATNERSLSALRDLVGGGHRGVLDNALSALDQSLNEKLSQLQSTWEASLGDYQSNLRDNESTEHDASFTNMVNRARERQDVVGQALSMGAGESDVLQAQLQALRNWSANQADINRSFFDTQSSVVSAITDLNQSTRTGMMNEELSTNAAKGQRWDDFYDAMSGTYTEMANLDQQNYLLGEETEAVKRQRAVHEGLLKWLDDGKNAEDYEPAKLKSTAALKPGSYTSEYAKKAAEAAASTWDNPGVSQETQDFSGWQAQTGGLSSAQVPAAQVNPGTRRRRPEGATLRRW